MATPRTSSSKQKTTVVRKVAKPAAPPKVTLPQPPATIAAEAKQAHDRKVTVFVPKAFIFTRDDGEVLAVAAGIQEMPRSMAAHWFCVANGVREHNGSTH